MRRYDRGYRAHGDCGRGQGHSCDQRFSSTQLKKKKEPQEKPEILELFILFGTRVKPGDEN